MKKRTSEKVRDLARKVADVASYAPLDDLDMAHAVMAAAFYISLQRARMSRADLSDWLRRLAQEVDEADEADAARVREVMRHQQDHASHPTTGA